MEAVLNNTFPEKNSSTQHKVAEELHAPSIREVAAINNQVSVFIDNVKVVHKSGSGALNSNNERTVGIHSRPLQDPIKNIIQRPT
ncbi:MAG: hypothetical protein V4456_16715 [Bacteroidota bacterium]